MDDSRNSPLHKFRYDLNLSPLDDDLEITLERRIHEVFLSFRGEDTRASFVSHLYASLRNAGINVFKDDESLPRGDHISDSLLRAIQQSEISVVVFSRNYAGSRWCLDELNKIMECHRTIGQVVLPVFYDVDPSEVRHQKGEFGKAFEKLENWILKGDEMLSLTVWEREKVPGWREALCQAAGIAGIVVLNSRNEREDIENIVETVMRHLDKTELFVADNPVGVEPRVQEMIQLLDQKLSNDVLLIGMWGMGGIGKTTIAKAIYNKIGRNFEGRSFLAHIREVWEQDAGQVHLQEQILYDIFKETKAKIPNMELGKNMLKDRLCHKRVLLVLDDVNELEQLNALCGSREWFGSGSRIIITTRDKHILRGRRVDNVHIMKRMDEGESIELFSWHAFKQASPSEKFIELTRNVIEYSGGLPLALEVLGSYLFEMDVTEWENVLEKLKRIPNHQVQKKLKISYDGLSDDTEREIFLDIACFFIGMDRNDVITILNGCGLFAENGIRVLVERCLVIVDDKNKLGMHDLLRDMGREIIREKSPKEPEERSRLWFHEDVLEVLSKETLMDKLKILNLSHSHYLRQTPDFSNFPNLEKLVLIDCPMLSEVSHTIGCLNKVLIINLRDCIGLRNLPRSIYKLKSLKTLVLSGCLKIDKLEEDFEQMESLTTFLADKTAITKVPFSIIRSKNIGYISLCGYEGFSRDVFPSIIWSWMSPMSSLSPHIETFAGMSSVIPLDLAISNSHHLLSISKELSKLRSLWIECDSELQLSQNATNILDALYNTTSKDLESYATSSQISNMNASASCIRKMHFSRSKSSIGSLLFQMGMSCEVTCTLEQNILQNMSSSEHGGCLVPGDSYPDWLAFSSEGSSVIFEIPQVNRHNLKTMICHVHYSSPDNVTSDDLKNLLVKNHTKATIFLYKGDALASFEDEEWQRVVSNIEPGNKVEIVVVFGKRLIVNKTTIYLVYEPMVEKVEHCRSPNENVIASSDDEMNEVKSICSQVEPMDDLKQKHKRRKFE
ncbi:TMV resistance protein N isoform X2 [Cajanus cajan]|uniref:TMV resistance protein N isoform X2 n=1 Tax=Cajanus cajan TaxID=3821 RepID=UPI0010FAF135|nr:TMV resistance protein N isoform X2 [Cajanus cajan]